MSAFKRAWFSLATTLLVGLSSRSTAAPGDQNWDANFALPAGLDGTVYALVTNQGSLFVGGEFSHAGGAPAQGIARWDGTNWSALGSGVSGRVYTLAVMDTNLYAAGAFITAGGIAATNIARWDGTNWHDLQGGSDGSDIFGPTTVIRTLAAQGDSLYAGGQFHSIGGVWATNVACWDGTNWHNLAEGIGIQTNDNGGGGGGAGRGGGAMVLAMTFVGQNLYVGGAFSRAGNSSATNVAGWNGTNWTNLGDGVSNGTGLVNALRNYNGLLCVGGVFTSAGGVGATNLALWDGSSWQSIGGGLSDSVGSLFSSGSNLYVGGSFWSAGGLSTRGVVRWDGVQWHALAGGVSGYADAICALGTNVVVGGWFGAASGMPAAFIAQYDGSAWSQLGIGAASNALVGGIFDVVAEGGQVYVGGSLASAGTNDTSCIAKWDGTRWSIPGGNLLRGQVSALAAGGGKIYAAGYFTVPELGITNLACWDGSNWTGLGIQNDLYIAQLAVVNGRLFVAGWFESIAGVAATNLGMWDGTNWSAVGGGLGSGSPPTIYSMAADGQSLYVGGNFLSIGGVSAQNIAKWDGTNWSALGGVPVSGSNSAMTVWSLAVFQRQLFAFAEFYDQQSQTDWTSIMRWDGANWSTIPNPFGPGDIYKIGAGPEYLYAVGNLAGDSSALNTVKWAGTDWLPLGGGLSGSSGNLVAIGLATGGNITCVTGDFLSAGDKLSYGFALWYEPPLPAITGLQKLPDGTFDFQILGSDGQNVQIQSSSNFTDWTSLDVRSLGPTPVEFLDNSAASNFCRFYKLVQVP